MTTLSLAIGSCNLADEQDLAALWKICGLVVSYNDPGEDIRLATAGKCSDILVARTPEGRVVASIMVGHDGHRGWLYYVATHPDIRGLGYGRVMVKAAERWLADRGVPKVQLLVRPTNNRVISFYEHLGFETADLTIMGKWLRGQQ